MATQLTIAAEVVGLAVGVVEATRVRLEPAGEELRAYCQEVGRRALASGLRGGEARRAAVRQLLRAGGYKPAGRNKPAQEYLLRTLHDESSLPDILNAVDLINAISLDCGLPISLLAAERAGPQLTVRYGRAGESYTFNRAGQDLSLEGLLCLCGGASSSPLGTPVKDSMPAKVRETDERVVGCIYAPRDAVGAEELREWSHRLADGLARWCGASQSASWLVPDAW